MFGDVFQVGFVSVSFVVVTEEVSVDSVPEPRFGMIRRPRRVGTD